MPKCEGDLLLRDRMKLYVAEHGLSVSGAATKLGVDRTTLWRFCRTGMARDDTKVRLRAALENRNEESVVSVAVDAVIADIPVSSSRRASLGMLAGCDLKQIRSACEGVLALLDVYESQLAVGKR